MCASRKKIYFFFSKLISVMHVHQLTLAIVSEEFLFIYHKTVSYLHISIIKQCCKTIYYFVEVCGLKFFENSPELKPEHAFKPDLNQTLKPKSVESSRVEVGVYVKVTTLHSWLLYRKRMLMCRSKIRPFP